MRTHHFALRIYASTFIALSVIALSACGPRLQPLNEIIMQEEPLKQISQSPETFRQIAPQDLQLLVAYLAVNEKARLNGEQFYQVQGKNLAQVLQDSSVWSGTMKQFLEQSKKVAQSISQQVSVRPSGRTFEDAESPMGKAHVLKITYEVINKTSRTVTGVQGNIKYIGSDGNQIALVHVIFDRKIEPGGTVIAYGHSPIIVGSSASKDMVAFAEAPVNAVRSEFLPLALRFEGGETIRVPSL